MNAKPFLFVAVAAAFAALLLGCPDKKVKYPLCDGDKDCKRGEHCINKKCAKCSKDTDCALGEQCTDGACQKRDDVCADDADCQNGQVCKDHKCTACQSNDECGPGGKCISGGCIKQGQCKSDDDCAEDEDCVNGACQKAKRGGGDSDLPKCELQPIYFGFDQYAVPEESKAILEKNAACLQQTTHAVSIIGYTDPRGPDEYNIGLSDDRAQAVITYLARLGVDPARMHKVPKGESEAVGTDENGWQKDRRVELKWE